MRLLVSATPMFVLVTNIWWQFILQVVILKLPELQEDGVVLCLTVHGAEPATVHQSHGGTFGVLCKGQNLAENTTVWVLWFFIQDGVEFLFKVWMTLSLLCLELSFVILVVKEAVSFEFNYGPVTPRAFILEVGVAPKSDPPLSVIIHWHDRAFSSQLPVFLAALGRCLDPWNAHWLPPKEILNYCVNNEGAFGTLVTSQAL